MASVPTRASLWQGFTSKAEALGARVERASGEAAVAKLLARSAAGRLTCTGGLAKRLPGIVERCEPLDGAASVAAEVVTIGVLAVAETGSVLVRETNRDRGACFLADHLWIVVPADQIAASLDEAFERLSGLIRDGVPYLTFMSGPSRSADIERTVTVGVHGPRELTIVVLDGEAT
jgi:L-lactate dehydrogenase complex protein LldG